MRPVTQITFKFDNKKTLVIKGQDCQSILDAWAKGGEHLVPQESTDVVCEHPKDGSKIGFFPDALTTKRVRMLLGLPCEDEAPSEDEPSTKGRKAVSK